MSNLDSSADDSEETPAKQSVAADGSLADSDAQLISSLKKRWPLWLLVSAGTGGVLIIGGALFLWFAWLLSRQPGPLRGGWVAWLPTVTGAEWFDAARTSAAILAILGVGGAALVAYRRQDTAELSHQFNVEAHRTAIQAQETAAKQLVLDSQKYQLEIERHGDDRERELRSRFTTVAEQLGGSHASKLAGAYALAALADDWHRFGSDRERQVCISLLCAQLRSAVRGDEVDDQFEFRDTLVAIIRQHRVVPGAAYLRPSEGEMDWRSCDLDLRGANLQRSDWLETDLSGVTLRGADLRQAMLNRADLSGANLYEANLSGALIGIAKLSRADIRLANFANARAGGADLSGADAYGAKFTNTGLFQARMDGMALAHADLSGADLTNATFAGISFDSATVWPQDFVKPWENNGAN